MQNFIMIKTIFDGYPVYCRMIESLDRLVMSVSKYGCIDGNYDTMKQMEKVIDLMMRKKRLWLLKVLVEEGVKSLKGEERYFMHSYFVRREKVDKIIGRRIMSHRTFFRRLNGALFKAGEYIKSLNYSNDLLFSILLSESWMRTIYFSYLGKGKNKSKKDCITADRKTKLKLEHAISVIY